MDLDDLDIIRLVVQGDQKAFACLVEKYQRPIYNLAGQMVGFGEDARDLTQEVFLQVYRHLERFKGDYRFSTWVYRIASNLTVDWIRKRRRQVRGLEYYESVSRPTPEEVYLEKEGARRVRDLLDSLPEKYRLALVLHYYHRFSYDEIAEILEVSRRTVESRLYRGRNMMRERIQQKEAGEKIRDGGERVEVSTGKRTVVRLPGLGR